MHRADSAAAEVLGASVKPLVDNVLRVVQVPWVPGKETLEQADKVVPPIDSTHRAKVNSVGSSDFHRTKASATLAQALCLGQVNCHRVVGILT